MLKRIFTAALIFVFCFSLAAGCGKAETPTEIEEENQTEQNTETEEKEELPIDDDVKTEDENTQQETVTENETEQEQVTETEQEQETEQKPEEPTSYTEKIKRPDQPIYDSPSYDGQYKGTVKEAGVYTIVEEVTDDEGNLWGKLKSGAGWVDLTDIRSFSAPISANFADEALLSGGDYQYVAVENQEYVSKVAFYAYEKLSYVSILATELTEDGFSVGERVYYVDEIMPDKPLVAELSFPGDMSMYIIEFEDESGAGCSYSVYISGRNGMLILDEEVFG